MTTALAEPGDAVLRPHAEHEHQAELAALAAGDDRPRPPGWRLSPWAVTTYLLGGTAPDGTALSFDNAQITGSVFLDEQASFQGQVRLPGATIGGQLACGGSTFTNPPGKKAWQLIDEAGCRGLMRGAAQVSEKHCNFLINTGNATAADIEGLGEEVRTRVKAKSGIQLEWEIKRVGRLK